MKVLNTLKAHCQAAVLLLLAVITTTVADDTCSPSEGTCKMYTILGKPSEFTESTVGVKLAVRRWIPEDDTIKSVVLFIHGGAGFHSGYSDIMGKSLQKAGIAVVAYDGVGSGYSEGIGGLRNYVDSIDTLTNDVSMFLNKLRKEYPSKKVFAMGESFGGNILVAQILKEQKNTVNATLADGYVLTGPVIQLLRKYAILEIQQCLEHPLTVISQCNNSGDVATKASYRHSELCGKVLSDVDNAGDGLF